MKLLLLLLTLITVDNSCSAAKSNQEQVTLEYTAISRGKYQRILIDNAHISVQNTRSATPKIINCSQAHWKTLMEALKGMDVETLPKLKGPTQKRLFDGAATANLTITYNAHNYKTPGFDHGSPHESIAPLIKEILTIAKNIE